MPRAQPVVVASTLLTISMKSFPWLTVLIQAIAENACRPPRLKMELPAVGIKRNWLFALLNTRDCGSAGEVNRLEKAAPFLGVPWLALAVASTGVPFKGQKPSGFIASTSLSYWVVCANAR